MKRRKRCIGCNLLRKPEYFWFETRRVRITKAGVVYLADADPVYRFDYCARCIHKFIRDKADKRKQDKKNAKRL